MGVHLLSNGRHGGWRRDRPKNDKDLQLNKLDLPAPSDNPSCDPAFFPLMKDQRTLGACTGESAALGVEYCVIEQKAEEGEDVRSDWWREWGLSGLAGYYWAREIAKTIRQDSGGEIRDAVDGIRRNGLPTEASWPYRVSKFRLRPSDAAMNTAVWHKLDGLKTYRCDGEGGSREATLTNILKALSLGMPVNLGFSCPKNWGDYDDTGNIPLPKGKYEDSGHAIIVLRANNGMLEGPNTWGDEIGGPQPQGSRIITPGGRGWFSISFDYVLSGDANDAWAFSLK